MESIDLLSQHIRRHNGVWLDKLEGFVEIIMTNFVAGRELTDNSAAFVVDFVESLTTLFAECRLELKGERLKTNRLEKKLSVLQTKIDMDTIQSCQLGEDNNEDSIDEESKENIHEETATAVKAVEVIQHIKDPSYSEIVRENRKVAQSNDKAQWDSIQMVDLTKLVKKPR